LYNLQGVIPAIATPFHEDYKINEKELRRLIRFYVDSGVHCILVGGSTGEYNLLTKEERKSIIKISVEEAAGVVPIMAGTGYNSTYETIELSYFAKEVGADCAMVITPYYPKTTQEGLFYHYKEIAENIDIPIIIYNWPAGTGVSISVDVVRNLSKIPNIVGIKNTSSQEETNLFIQITQNQEDFSVVTGLETLLLPTLACGGAGGIGVTYGIIPKQSVRLYDLILDNKFDEAKKLHNKLLPLFEAIFKEPNPVPLKAALNKIGFSVGPARLPLRPISKELDKEIENILANLSSI
jgi:4-hydroxy-tetrahydrodipicolinate synthase